MSKDNTPNHGSNNGSALLHVRVGLEGSAGGIVAGRGVGGTYGDLAGSATGFTVMIGTVLYITANTFDVITALLVVHFIYHPYIFAV